MHDLKKFYIYSVIHILKYWYGFGKIKTRTIYAQAYHETGDFKSKVFLENNNLFGTRHPVKRDSTSLGTKNSHGFYSSIFDGIRDYYLRQKYFTNQAFKNKVIANQGDNVYMISTQQSGYAEAQNYVSVWRKVYNYVFKEVKIYHTVLIVIMFTITAITVFINPIKKLLK